MKTKLALLLLTLTLAAGNAAALLPAWGPGASLGEIQEILQQMRAQRERIPQRPAKLGKAEDVYKGVFASVDQKRYLGLIQDMSGVNPVTVGGRTFSITDRYTPASKALYRKYWINYFQSLGMTTREIPYANSHDNGEDQGHDVEAVLPGASPDSVVIIVHYDSIGPNGADNPGADDDMSGMATLMETARVLAAHKGKLAHTVRFVAADYEEWGGLEGARAYAKYIQDLSRKQNFKVVAAIDDEQSGWNEGSDNVFDVFSCGGATDSTAMGDELVETAALYSKMTTTRACMGENSDHYAMWEIGVPAVVFSEHDPFNNPHFDQEGGDTFDKIDQGYIFRIAQVGVTFAARVVGVSK